MCQRVHAFCNFNKKETDSKMGNPAHTFKNMYPVLHFIRESQIKYKNVMCWSSRKIEMG